MDLVETKISNRISLMWMRITSLRIRNLLLIKMMQICDHLTTDPPSFRLHASMLSLQTFILRVHGLLRIHCDPRKFLNFDFNADPDPAFYSNADPDPASKNNEDPCDRATVLLSL
jgi:hypothetical protein